MDKQKSVSSVISIALLVLIIVILSSTVYFYVLDLNNKDKKGSSVGVIFEEKERGVEAEFIKYGSDNLTIKTSGKEFRFDYSTGRDLFFEGLSEELLFINEEDTLVLKYSPEKVYNGSLNVTGDGVNLVDGFILKTKSDEAGEKSKHKVRFGVGNTGVVGSSLGSVKVKYPNKFNVSGLVDKCESLHNGSSPPCSSLVEAGIDSDGDNIINRKATKDVECCPPSDGVIPKNDQSTIEIQFSGNTNIKKNEVIIVRYKKIKNGDEGVKNVSIKVNGNVEKKRQNFNRLDNLNLKSGLLNFNKATDKPLLSSRCS